MCLCTLGDVVHIFTLRFCCFEKHVNPGIDKEYLASGLFIEALKVTARPSLSFTHSERQFILAKLRLLVAARLLLVGGWRFTNHDSLLCY